MRASITRTIGRSSQSMNSPGIERACLFLSSKVRIVDSSSKAHPNQSSRDVHTLLLD